MTAPAPRKLLNWLLLLLTALLGLVTSPAHADTGLQLSPERPQVDAWPALRMLSDPIQA